jgi:DNA segregation ATPase FtsK/SpoIIIE, S-DNA-T family
MARRKSQQPPTWQDLTRWWAELQENVSLELVGLILFLVGGFLLLTLLPGGGSLSQSLPWLTGMVGWTAPLMALALLVTGAVLMLGERAGYWSVEAIVGAELLLLALQMGTFLWQHSEPDWAPQIDGASGGLVGVTLGSLLLAGFGRWPAFVILLLMGGVGLYFLARYTPLAYLTGRGIPVPSPLQALRTRWVQPGEHPAPQPTIGVRRPVSTNFVPPHDPLPTEETPAIAKKAGRKAKTSAPPVVEDSPQNGVHPSADNGATSAKPAERKAKPRTVTAEATAMQAVTTSGHLPPLDLLTADDASPQRVDVEALQVLIEETLGDFNVPVRTVHVESGPTVTQFGVEPLYLERAGQRRKVRVSRIVNLADDLALALAVPAVRIEAPVPGRPYVGIEVPNADKQRVRLRGIMESKAMTQGGTLALPLGRNTAGAPVVMDLARAPHMLIAGATGAGKSVCINTIISGLLMQHGPERLRFVMVDPKMVELPGYNGIPHLIGNVITDVEQVMGGAHLAAPADGRPLSPLSAGRCAQPGELQRVGPEGEQER